MPEARFSSVAAGVLPNQPGRLQAGFLEVKSFVALHLGAKLQCERESERFFIGGGNTSACKNATLAVPW